MSKDTKLFPVIMPVGLVKDLKHQAVIEGRSGSSIIRELLVQKLREAGLDLKLTTDAPKK